MDELTMRVKDLEARVKMLETGVVDKPKKKRAQSEKQKHNAEQFKKLYHEMAPSLKMENPGIKSSEIFTKVHAKLKESKIQSQRKGLRNYCALINIKHAYPVH